MDDRDKSGGEAKQANEIVGEACRQMFIWAANQLRGVSYFPPLLVGDLDIHEINRLAEAKRPILPRRR